MNKITFLFFLLIGFAVHAQFSLETSIGAIYDGDVITTSTVEEKGSDLRFNIINDSDESIAIRLKVKSIDNTNGRNFELCFGGDCHQQIQEGGVYPQNDPGYFVIPAQGIFDSGLNRLWNHVAEGNTAAENIIYEFEFQRLDPTSMAVVEKLQFTYQYKHPEETAENTKKEVKVRLPRTVIRGGNLTVEAEETLTYQIYNLIGRKVKEDQIRSGIYQIDISDLSSQIYIVRFQNQQGLVKTQKIVVD